MLKNEAKSRQDAATMGIYVHWPYCVSKCPYCDFNSHVARVFSDDDYVEAIECELDHWAGQSDPLPVASVFFGGGTPSLMAPATVAAILEHIVRRFNVLPGAEISMEANPSSVEAARFEAVAEAGVNRLSLGVQSFEDAALKRLGRPHGADEALRAIDTARRHFPRISFDMIYARDGQRPEDWREELKRAVGLARGHLSAYQLTIEPGTRYHALDAAGELRLPHGEAAERFFDLTRQVCAAEGLTPYEISNYAAVGEESRHNLVYWRCRPYLGVGPGAHGRVSKAGRRFASSVVRSPARWLQQVRAQGHGLESFEALSEAEQADEMLLMGLRLAEGVDLAALIALTGHAPSIDAMTALTEAGFVCRNVGENRLHVTEAGAKILNHVIRRLSEAMQPTTDIAPEEAVTGSCRSAG